MQELFAGLAMTVDVAHAVTMLAWGAGLPLLFWHRFAKLSWAYTWFAVAFVVVSVGSHATLGECLLTTLARELWQASGSGRSHLPFTAVLANTIAGVRPSERSVVLAWELAVLATGLGSLWSWHKARANRSARVDSSCS
jgi:hypothetical protein